MTFNIPEQFKNLPVARNLDRYDPEENFILVAHTGSGKTMLIPAYLHSRTGRKILMRQPTRVATRSAYEGLKEFWGPLGFHIGMMTSEDTIGTIDDNDITVVTDGEMTHILRQPKYKFTCIFDEIHSQMPATEIELAIVKTYMNKGMDIRVVLLSATIRPENILNHFETLNSNPQTKAYIAMICDALDAGEGVNEIDQKQFLKAYYTEGVAFEITKKIMRPLTAEVLPEMDFARRMAKEKKRGLIFECTRNQVAEIVANIQDDPLLPPAMEANADIDARTIKRFVDEHEPSIVVATVALATSITMPFDEVLIMDRGIDSTYEDGIVKTVTNIPLDNNGILQRAGRVGRVKPGVAILCSEHEKEVEDEDHTRVMMVPLRQSWADIRPTLIAPPLEKLPPDAVVLTCASYDIDVRDLDTLSHLNPDDIEASIQRLGRWGLIQKNGYLKITPKGRRVFSLPLEIRMGVLLVDCPQEILPAIVAITAMGDGTYHMFKPYVSRKNPDTGENERVNGCEFLEADMKDPDSVLMVKVKVLQQYFRLRADGEGLANIWADTNGFLIKKIERIAYQWFNIISKGLKRGEAKIRADFIAMDLTQVRVKILEYLTCTHVYERNVLQYNADKGYYHGSWMGRWTIMGGDQRTLMGKDYWGEGIEVIGVPRVMTKKSGDGEFCFWGDTTIVKILTRWDVQEAMEEM